MKRRKIIGGCALVAWLALLPPSGSAGVLAAQGGAMLREALRDPAAIFSGRSPGERGAGALVQSKPHMAAAPSERVLSPVLERPGIPIPANLDNLPNKVMDVIAPGAAPVPGTPGANIAALPLPLLGVPGSSGGIIPSGTGSSGGSGGSGGSSSGGLTPPVPPPTPVVSAVPEPSTWLMMIAGVGLIGLQLRRRRATGVARAI